ncbi:lipopolysaccharide biosynthesis protein [Bacteroides clarus]|uniref:Lipopolysaccharide biosynthesis protein n=2 Tax=Bacteroides clarus TaxID=626929 RepID=A0A1Y3Z031_9BACE|nr:lipopolysaccharide biosynthesis protein [Bacteroides clarus]
MSVKQEMINGVIWTAIQKYSGLLIQLFVTAILARLLEPIDFGVIAIASVLISFLGMFTEMGFSAAIIQNQSLLQKDLNSIYSFCTYVGCITCVIFFFSSNYIATYYVDQRLSTICKLLSVNMLFSGLNIVPNALILKAKRFKLLAKRTLGFQLISGIISILAAYSGLGVYTLLISPIFTAIGVFFVNYHIYPQKFVFRINFDSIKKVVNFSIFDFLSNFVNYFSRNLDKLIIGRYFSLNELGYYEKSYRLMMMPLEYITRTIDPVVHPIFSQFQNDKFYLSKKYNQIVKLISTISFPLGAFLYFAAHDLIHLFFGDKWDAAIPVFQILSISVPLQMILSTIGGIYKSTGKVNWQFFGGNLNTVITISGFILAAIYYKSIEAIAWAWVTTLTINFINSYIILYAFCLKQSPLPMLRELIVPFGIMITIFTSLYFIQPHIISLPTLLSLSISTAITITEMLFITHITKRYDIIKLFILIYNKIRIKNNFN